MTSKIETQIQERCQENDAHELELQNLREAQESERQTVDIELQRTIEEKIALDSI
jgi:hypothetical protein